MVCRQCANAGGVPSELELSKSFNISSALGEEGEANFSAYCASKFGVIGLTQVVADETKESGLRVYAV